MQSTHLDIAAPNATDEASEERGNSPYLSLDTAENDDSDSGEMESADVLEELKPRPISTHRKREISQTADKLPIPDDAERVKRLSSASGSTYVTTRSGRSSVETFRTATTGNFSLYRASTMSRSSWYNLLKSRDLIPSTFDEKNWSGRGEHAEFKPNEATKISEILQVEEFLGSSGSTVVQKVRCRRILLARKTIKCNRTLKRSDALKEVEHLRRLPHSHIVQVVGTYTFKQEFSILLYPAAEQNLDSFLEGIRVDYPGPGGIIHFEAAFPKLHAVYTFFGCLARTLMFLHQKLTKHMDIKPKNLLVKRRRDGDETIHPKYKIYLADFGITRSYARAVDAETESPTGFTRLYAAPEVADQRKRGLSADVFSLGCVFAEMLGVLTGNDREATHKKLKSLLVSDEYAPASYATNITLVTEWLRELSRENLHNHFFHLLHPLPDQLAQLLELEPTRRPTAESIASWFKLSEPCCEQPSAPDALGIEDETDDDLFNDPTANDATSGHEKSLFHVSRAILNSLGTVPLLEPLLSQLFQEEGNEETDPVELLWQLLRRGDALLAIYNSLCPNDPLSIPYYLQGRKLNKWVASNFLRLCSERLKLPSSELFMLVDLYGDSTNGFVKVTRIIQRIIDLLHHDQNLDYESSLPIYIRDRRNQAPTLPQGYQWFVDWFVTVERTHVSELALLHSFKEHVVRNAVLSGDEVHVIFLNLDSVLDMNRRFLVAVEQLYSRSHQDVDWANLFLTWVHYFAVLEPYASNQVDGLISAMQHYRKLQGGVSSSRMLRLVRHPDQLSSFLSEPVEHLRRHQWFLGKLHDLSTHESSRIMVTDAREKLSSLLQRITEHAHNKKSIKVIEELNDRVVDWKHHKVATFGHLVFHGIYYVKKLGDLAKRRKYIVFLFERILCLFKEIVVSPKKKSRISLFNRTPQDVSPPGQPRLQLVGRIFIQNVTSVDSTPSSTRPQELQVFWKGEVDIESFIIEFPLLTSRDEWATAIERRRRDMEVSLSPLTALGNMSLKNPYPSDSESENDITGKTMTSEPPALHLTRSAFHDDALPPEIMVRVRAPSMTKVTVNLEIETTISYRALLLRIIAYASNVRTPPEFSTGLFKLKYFDDGDFITIGDDEDVRMAFETWWDAHQQKSHADIPEEERLLLYLESTGQSTMSRNMIV